MVEDWGIWRPDFYSDVITSRSVVVEKSNTQINWQIDKSYVVSAASTVIDTVYTVPSGYNLILDTGLISVRDSCINKIQLFTSSSLLGDYRFDMRGDLGSIVAGQLIPSGTAIVAYIYNNDGMTSEFSLVLAGFLSVVVT